jgi:hypothetical protein
MDRKDKELNDIIDRLAAGEEVTPSPETSSETRENILAAKKLLECTQEPGPEFQENLKRRVINLFESREAAQPRSLSWRERIAGFFTTPSIWRTAAAAATIGAIALLVVWAAGLLPFQSPNVPPVVGTTLPAVITVEPATAGIVSVPAGQEVRLELLLRNAGESAVTVRPFPPEIWISNPLFRTPLRIFAAGESHFEILPSGEAAYTLIWDQKSGSGEQVPPGVYVLSVVNVSIYRGDNSEPTVTDFPAVAQIEIKPVDLGSW